LVQINQNNKYKPFDSLTDEQKKQQDEDLFQTSRLVNCGWFLQVIFGDYIRCAFISSSPLSLDVVADPPSLLSSLLLSVVVCSVILNVNQTDSTWALIPTGEIKSLIGGQVDRGTGNAVSVEFDRESTYTLSIDRVYPITGTNSSLFASFVNSPLPLAYCCRKEGYSMD